MPELDTLGTIIKNTVEAEPNTNFLTDAELAKLTGIETAADVTDAANVAAAGAFMKSTDDLDDLTEGSTNKHFTNTEKTKLAHLTVTQAVDLDAIEARVNDLDAAVILKGVWDASAGTFPGAGVAQAGWSYIVSVAGTVGGIPFAVNDRAIAIADNASTSTYASNWHKADYTDQVLSVNSLTGAVTLTQDNIGDGATYKQYSAADKTKLAAIAAGATANDTDVNLKTHSIPVAVGDESTAMTTGTGKVTFRMPYAFNLTKVKLSVNTAPTGSTIIVDVNKNGASIFTTRPSIDATEKTTQSAAVAAVLTATPLALADDDEISIDIDQIGSTIAGAGLKVYLIGYRP